MYSTPSHERPDGPAFGGGSRDSTGHCCQRSHAPRTACVLDAAAHGLGGKRASQCCLALQLLDASAVARRIRQAGAYRKFFGIELKAVSIPGGPDLRPVLAFYCRTTTAEPREQFRKAALSNSIG